MGLDYIHDTVFSPVKTFYKIKSERPVLLDSLLMFCFMHILLLGVSYLVMSLIRLYNTEYLSWFIGLPSMLFLAEPGFSSFILSVGFALIEILTLTGIIHIISEKAGSRGSFSSLVMMFSLTQVVSIISVISFVSLQKIVEVGPSIYVLPFFSIIIGIFIWRLALYFIGIRVNYGFKAETTFIVMILSYILFSMVSVWFLSYFIRSGPIMYLTKIGRIQTLESVATIT